MLNIGTATARDGGELYQQASDLAVMLALAQHMAKKTFIDVGAEKGSFSKALLDLEFSGTLIEPFPAHLPVLQKVVEGRSALVLPVAIDDSDHEGLLHIAAAADGTTMDYFHSLHRDEANSHARHSEAIPVSCRSLRSLAEEGIIESEVGILKIDTEGNDLKVINGLGHVKAEVLICEFVTPKLYKTWENSFPEVLVKAARQRGYEKCIAVKRFGPFEMVDFDPAGFVDGQWGNLIFTSNALLALAREKLHELALRAEKRHVTTLTEQQQSLEEKEAVIQTLNQACVERLVMIEALNVKVNLKRAKERELRAKVEALREKIARLLEKA